MKAVILAAGLGGRLRPITGAIPKCMVPVNGVRIIDKQIRNLKEAGVEDVVVVSGYKAELLEKHLADTWPGVRTVRNVRHAETNNMYSLFLAREAVRGCGFLLMNADVYFDGGMLKGLLEGGDASKIACERGRYFEESMKIVFDGEKITHIGKEVPESVSYAVSIDVYRISAKDGEKLFDEIEDTVVRRKDENSWTEAALDRIFPATSFVPHEIDGRWFEIDTIEDLNAAERLFRD